MMPTSLLTIEGLRDGVDDAIRAQLTALGDELDRTGPATAPLSTALADLASGGKRLRAAFCYWGWRAHGGTTDSPERDAVLRVGAALELFQASALFHDDVMDASHVRRGRPTAHVEFTTRHRTHGWSGSPERFGENVAILLGDLALVAGDRLLAHALERISAPAGARAHKVFGQMQTQVIAGQYLDIHAQGLPFGLDPRQDEDRARQVVRAKTAGYSVAHPIALGAALAGADDARIHRVIALALPIGEAFQLRDDILGVFGDETLTGKPSGDDLREGKRTVLACRTLALCSPGDRARFLASFGNPQLSDEHVEQLRTIIRDSGALAAVEQLIADLSRDAAHQVGDGLDPDSAHMLESLAEAALHRRA